MIEKRTVFILGAGASCPYNFPTASGLRRSILNETPKRYGQYMRGFGTEHAMLKLAHGYPDESIMKQFIESFALSSTESIDLFLSRNPQFVQMGKMAICLAILDAERRSYFREDVPERKQDWYFYLYNRLTKGLTGPDSCCGFPQSNIAFITFNYDRSFEHFLFDSILYSFEGMDFEKVRELACRIPIVHVYGQVGGLSWQQAQARVKYGGESVDFSTIDLLRLIQDLYVVHEERLNPQLGKAREEITKAERIFFLGFGYAKENLEAIGLPGALRRHHQIYGTAKGWIMKEIHGLKCDFLLTFQRLADADGERFGARNTVEIQDCDCVQLLRDFL
jgi:hypothetical protein